ncbi:MAG: ABC transporter ATP-binding protein [Christensenellaceae bacterium]|nr:ABC transporter ATP-binding protein [Christensenellaceae bacterium]
MSRTFEVNELYAGYDKQIILKDINLSVLMNKISVILGSNGSGKSTLLKAMARLILPEKGAIKLDGKAIHELPTKKLAQKIGLLPQSPLVPEGITVADLVSRGRFPYQSMFKGLTNEDYNIIAEALELVGISDLAERNVDELSGGQRQRVWIAMALVQQTDILLLDEPTTFLDVAYQVEILDTLTELNKKKNITIIMVLHDVNLSARYADYIFAIKDGSLIAEGSSKHVITEENISRIYGLDSLVIEDPYSKTPMVIPKGRNII